jgi:hypothetical protein
MRGNSARLRIAERAHGNKKRLPIQELRRSPGDGDRADR